MKAVTNATLANYKILRPDTQIGVLMLAGGAASRLGCGNKCLVPYGDSTLLAYQLAKIPEHCPVALIVNSESHELISQYLLTQGLYRLNLELIIQDNLPYLNQDCMPLPQLGPNGNGQALYLLYKHHIWSEWLAQGVTHVSVIPIDNPKCQPLRWSVTSSQLMVKAILKKPGEAAGILATDDSGRLTAAEYHQYPDFQGAYAYTGMFLCTTEWLQTIYAAGNVDLPLHRVLKTIPGTDIQAYKQEYFIFDLFQYATSWQAIIVDRRQEFAPIKTAADLRSVQASTE